MTAIDGVMSEQAGTPKMPLRVLLDGRYGYRRFDINSPIILGLGKLGLVHDIFSSGPHGPSRSAQAPYAGSGAIAVPSSFDRVAGDMNSFGGKRAISHPEATA